MKKTVTFVAYNIYGIGGTVRFISDTANFLVKNGFSVNIISLYSYNLKPSFYFDPAIRIINAIKRNKLSALGRFLTKYKSFMEHPDSEAMPELSAYSDVILAKIFLFLKTDVLICSLPYFAKIASRFHFFPRTLIAQDHKGYQTHTESYRAFLLSIFNSVDCLHCINKTDLAYYERELHKEPKVFSIYNSTALHRKNADLTSKVMISCGRLAHQKNYQSLIRAFAVFLRAFPDWQLLILGNGQEKKSIIEEIITNNVSSNVALIPATNSIYEYLLGSSLYVCSSRYESFCIAILEAMACGLPVISYECDGPMEYIRHLSNGILVTQGDEAALAKAMMTCAANLELREKLGKAAKQTVARDFSIEAVGEQWLQLLR